MCEITKQAAESSESKHVMRKQVEPSVDRDGASSYTIYYNSVCVGFFFFFQVEEGKRNTLTEERRQVRDGLQEQLRVHRLVRRQLSELVIQEKRHGPAVVGSSGSEQLFGWRENPELCFLVRWGGEAPPASPYHFRPPPNRWGKYVHMGVFRKKNNKKNAPSPQ